MLVPTKQELLEFCDRVLKKWAQYQRGDARLVFAMNAMKIGVLWTDEDTLETIWGEILNWSFVLPYKKAIAQAREENIERSLEMGKVKGLHKV